MNETAIRIADVMFRYPARSAEDAGFVLHCASLIVARGARLAIFGPSGSGKSTLLDLIAGALVPDHGAVEVLGANLARLSERERRAHRIARMGFVFQDFPLVEHLTVHDNVLLPFRLNHALRLDAAARSRASALLDELGLGGRSHRLPKMLSQGERQRVAIARALVTEPELLLADEPTAGLDTDRADAVMALVEDQCARRGLTLLVVSHDPRTLSRFTWSIDVRTLATGAASR